MLTKLYMIRISSIMGLLLLFATASMAAIHVDINGNPLMLNTPPMLMGGTTMVPLRSIFESLGARVHWNDAMRTITATKNDTTVQLGIGDRRATVNGQDVMLDTPARIVNGTTMVPLRFISEALGAEVRWDESAQSVSISTDIPSKQTAQASSSTDTSYREPDELSSVYQGAANRMADVMASNIPDGTVIPVRLDQPLSSKTSRLGDWVSVTVRSHRNGDVEFPQGTKLRGVVTEAQQAGDGQPGILALDFRQVILPDGRKINAQGSLVSLDDKTVQQTSDGRLVTRSKDTDPLKFIGIGAAGGLILGKLTKHTLEGTILGAAAGYLYSQNDKKKNRATDVNVSANTEFGVRLSHAVDYYPTRSFAKAREMYVSSLSLPAQSTSQNIRVMAGGRDIAFANARPFSENGVVLVPLAPVLNQEGVAYKYDDYSKSINLDTSEGPLQLDIGKPYAMLNGEQEQLEAPAQVRDGVVYVPLHFLAIATGSSVRWNSNTNTAALDMIQ